MIVIVAEKPKPHTSECIDVKMMCKNCRYAFEPEDEWLTCPECLHNHCEICGHCWPCEDDSCPQCNKVEDLFDRPTKNWDLRRIPGTSLTYWA